MLLVRVNLSVIQLWSKAAPRGAVWPREWTRASERVVRTFVCVRARVCYVRVRASLVQVNESVRSNNSFKWNDSPFSDSSSSHDSKALNISKNVKLRTIVYHRLYFCTYKQTLYVFIYFNYTILFALRCLHNPRFESWGRLHKRFCIKDLKVIVR